MSSRKPNEKLKNQVKERANNICEYCLSQADFSSQPFAIEHIIPFIKGGKTVLGNLAYACQGCNGHKFTHTEGHDSITRQKISLFNPRKQKWNEHFIWNENFTLIIGITPCGRATVETLQLNREGCINLRTALFVFGKHPPSNFD
jgi:hypothetical protein